MIFELVQDFYDAVTTMPKEHTKHRILELLEEAVRRDIHFIDRHPTTLFQCMWNTCWWYDSPETAGHYIEPEGGWQQPPPWDQMEHILSGLLETWRVGKERNLSDFFWIRSLRPPRHSLGSGQVMVLSGHSNYVNSIAYSPDGYRIASGSSDRTVRVWDIQTGKELTIPREHEGSVTTVAFSPNGQWIASTIEPVAGITNLVSAMVRLWDARTDTEVVVFPGQVLGMTTLAFAPDSQRIATASHDGTIRLWDTRNGTELGILDEYYVYSLAFSPNGRLLASGSDHNTIRIWDTRKLAELAVFHGHKSRVTSVAFSSDGRRIVSGSYDRTIRVWDVGNGRVLAILHTSEAIQSVMFSPDGKQIISGSNDKTVRLWDARLHTELAALHGHEDIVLSVVFSPDGQQIASGSRDGVIRLWDVRRQSIGNQCLLRTFQLTSILAFSPDGQQIVSGSEDKTVRVWDAQTGKELVVLHGHKARVQSVAFSPDGQRIVSGSEDKTVRVWDVQTGKEHTVLRIHDFPLSHVVTFSSDGRWIASVSNTVRIWDALSGAELATIPLNTDQMFVDGVELFPCGRRIVVIGIGYSKSQHLRTTRVYDTFTAESIQMIRGVSTAEAVAGGSRQFPFQIVQGGLDTIIECVDNKCPVGWFPAKIPIFIHVRTCPSGHSWIAPTVEHVYLIALEGKGAQ